ncbi:O-methyltransferase [Candidatus Omnitrophota bacterium]
MKHVVQAIQEVCTDRQNSILAIETGTIRSFNEKHESTRHIAETLGERGELISIDINEESIAISKKICINLSNITWIVSDSLTYFKHLTNEIFDFVLLDSMNDQDFIFNEFCLVLPHMRVGGIIMIDDAGITVDGKQYDDTPAQKGRKVWAFLNKHNIPYAVLPIPHRKETQLKVWFTKDILDRL